MGKDTKRAYKVVPVDEDEPDFGDPPRNWGRVASMAGVWVVVLLGSAWMAPSFASGGSSDEVDSLEEPAASPANAARRYLRFGSDGDFDQANAALCDQASPEVTVDTLIEIRAAYDEEKSYPSVDPVTDDPISSDDGFLVNAKIIYDFGDSTREKHFIVTVSALEDGGYCVSDVVLDEAEPEETSGETTNPRALAAEFLSSMFVVRDLQEATGYLCAEYDGPEPEELDRAISEWEALFGEADVAQDFEGDPEHFGTQTAVAMSVKLSSDTTGTVESFSFKVTVEGDCVAALSGGEALLNSAED